MWVCNTEGLGTMPWVLLLEMEHMDRGENGRAYCMLAEHLAAETC